MTEPAAPDAPTRVIKYFDNLVPMQTRNKILGYVMRSKFELGWVDVAFGPKSTYKSLHSKFTKQEAYDCGLGDALDNSYEITGLLVDYEFSHCIVNLSVAMDTNFTHTHNPGERVVLYYANLEWESSWYGETQFFNDTDTEVIFTVRYTPGRVLVFDGDIPHSIRPQSLLGPQYRFTVATVYKKIQEVINEQI